MDIDLQCHCGKVTGTAHDVSPSSGIRLVCYCHDCQMYGHHLQMAAEQAARDIQNDLPPVQILDEYGGTDIYQMPPAKLQIHSGLEQLACLRLTAKGTYRWYTRCCHTPVGNGLTAGVPFIGIIHNFIHPAAQRQQLLGEVRAYVNLKSASEPLLEKQLRQQGCRTAQGFAPGPALKLLCNMLVWKCKGWHAPSPLFSAAGEPVSQPEILIPDAKKALNG